MIRVDVSVQASKQEASDCTPSSRPVALLPEIRNGWQIVVPRLLVVVYCKEGGAVRFLKKKPRQRKGFVGIVNIMSKFDT